VNDVKIVEYILSMRELALMFTGVGSKFTSEDVFIDMFSNPNVWQFGFFFFWGGFSRNVWYIVLHIPPSCGLWVFFSHLTTGLQGRVLMMTHHLNIVDISPIARLSYIPYILSGAKRALSHVRRSIIPP
jgi:hypothetical protein